MVEEAPGESGFQSCITGGWEDGEGRLGRGFGLTPRGPPPQPSPRARAGQGRDLRAGPQKGGGGRYPSDSRRLRLGAERQSLSLSATPCATAPQPRCVSAAAFPPPPPPTPPPPCPTSPVPGRCAAARISTSSSRRWVSWCGGYAGSVRSSCEAPGSQRGWPGVGGGQEGVKGEMNLFPLRFPPLPNPDPEESGLRTQGGSTTVCWTFGAFLDGSIFISC